MVISMIGWKLDWLETRLAEDMSGLSADYNCMDGKQGPVLDIGTAFIV